MAKKLKETYIHTYIHTDRLPLVVLSAAVAAKNTTWTFKYGQKIEYLRYTKQKKNNGHMNKRSCKPILV